jgi:hypothetical protein
MILQKTGTDLFSKILGFGMLFSGAALVVHILTGISLHFTLALAATLLACAAGLIWRRATVDQRRRLGKIARLGLLSGVLATIAYDATKFALSQLDPSPYNPFEATRVFGLLLAGQSAPVPAIYAVGTAFHLLNGVAFATAFCFLFGRRSSIWAGVAWGLFLEMFQLTLYPGWLSVKFLSEFMQISALSHVAYGSVLGLSARYGLGSDLARTGKGSL